jgi:type III pantothenate kinase
MVVMYANFTAPKIHISEQAPRVLVAVDIGNSGIKVGKFDRDAIAEGLFGEGRHGRDFALPDPKSTFELPIAHATGEFDLRALGLWCEANVSSATQWLIGSVHRRAGALLTTTINAWSKQLDVRWSVRNLSYNDVPLKLRVDEPTKVGIDRLLAALAADRLRNENNAAIVIDLGTAITVDLVEADGAFAGGAILPGIGMASRALSDQTDALPHVVLGEAEAPPSPVGKSTQTAIEAGLYWGTVGAVTQLVKQVSAELSNPPEVFITGGGAPVVVDSIRAKLQLDYIPHLVLSGIALLETLAGHAHEG